MIRLGLRLAVGGGRQAAARLGVIAGAVAIGVTLLLVTLAGINAITAQNQRAAWLATAPARAGHGSHDGTPASARMPDAEPLWWLLSIGRFGTQVIYRVDVAATGPRSPIPPGLHHLPGPGQYYASPALSALLRTTPAAELGDRFSGSQAGTIGPAALPAPDSLIIVVGHDASQLSKVPTAQEVTSIQVTPGSGNGPAGLGAPALQAVLAVAAAALLFPVLIFISAATRLSAARREQRFAAIRLAGGTPRQVSVLAATEASAAAVAGTALGFILFFALRPALQHITFTGEQLAPGDLSLRLAFTAVPLIEARAYLDDWRETHEFALAATRRAHHIRGQAAMHCSVGALDLIQQRFVQARREFAAAEQLFHDAGDEEGKGLAACYTAYVDWMEERYDDSARHCEEALAISRRAGDQIAEAYALQGIAYVKLEKGDPDEAKRILSEALRLCRKGRPGRIKETVLHCLGLVQMRTGEFTHAVVSLGEALAIARGLRDVVAETSDLLDMGIAKLRLGELEQARRALKRALGLAVTASHRLHEARAQLGLSELALIDGDPGQAVTLGQQAAGAFRRIGARLYEVQALMLLHEAHAALEDSAAADAAAAQAPTVLVCRDTGDVGEPSLHTALRGADQLSR
jgi:tetratricopeptide (TPR) repeat protein